MTILAADGTVLGESDEDPRQLDNRLDRPEIQQARLQGQGNSTRFSQTLGTEMMYSAVTVEAGGQIVGSYNFV